MTRSSQRRWKSRALAYAKRINAFLAHGERTNWDAPGRVPKFREDPALAAAGLAAIRAANQTGDLARLRQGWPPAHHLVLPLLDEKALAIPALFALGDGSFVARLGETYRPGRVVHVQGRTAHTVKGILYVGRSPNRRYFAVANAKGVSVTDGWQGPELWRSGWPSGWEGVPKGVKLKPGRPPGYLHDLIPFPNGKRLLLVCDYGVFVLSPDRITRLYPSSKAIRERWREAVQESPGEALSLDFDMMHGTVSADGKWIAIGEQGSSHLMFDSRLRQVADIGHLSEYPHHACFSGDSQTVILNSCHFYHGATIAVNARDWPGLDTAPYAPTGKTPAVEEMSRVYAAVHRKDEFIIGNAHGYLRAFTAKGQFRWSHHLGSTVSALDLSPDGQHLYAGTYAGWVVKLALDTHQPAPWEIGSGHHSERQRWLFWKDEPQPLLW